MRKRSTRSWLYTIAKFQGDLNAIQKGKVPRRVVRRVAGKVVGRGFARWLG